MVEKLVRQISNTDVILANGCMPVFIDAKSKGPDVRVDPVGRFH